jgi:hypothetical protein
MARWRRQEKLDGPWPLRAAFLFYLSPKILTQPEAHLCTCAFLLCVALVMTDREEVPLTHGRGVCGSGNRSHPHPARVPAIAKRRETILKEGVALAEAAFTLTPATAVIAVSPGATGCKRKLPSSSTDSPVTKRLDVTSVTELASTEDTMMKYKWPQGLGPDPASRPAVLPVKGPLRCGVGRRAPPVCAVPAA